MYTDRCSLWASCSLSRRCRRSTRHGGLPLQAHQQCFPPVGQVCAAEASFECAWKCSDADNHMYISMHMHTHTNMHKQTHMCICLHPLNSQMCSHSFFLPDACIQSFCKNYSLKIHQVVFFMFLTYSLASNVLFSAP